MYGDRASSRSVFGSIDWWLLGTYMCLVIIGILNIYASIHSSDTLGFWDIHGRSGRQMLWWGISLAVGLTILFALPPRLYEMFSLPLYLLSLALLAAVIFLGTEVNGSNSWFTLGSVSFQPAELSKITTSLMLAAYMSRTDFRMRDWKNFLAVLAILLLPMVLIVGSKETGSALVYFGFAFMLYREGLSGWFLVMGGMAVLLFVLTLVASPYVALLVLAAFVVLVIGLHTDKLKWFLIYGVPAAVFLSFLPMIFRAVEKAIYQGDAEAALPVQPIHVLLAIIVLMLPVAIVLAYRRRHNFTYVALVGLLLGIALIFSTDFIFNSVLQPHQRKRIEVLLNMTEDPAGVGYNVRQSMIAIGSGGFAGKGYLQGTQTTFGFVPEQSTDFIFCTVGEEWGFLGSAAVVLLFCFMIWRIIRDSEKCRGAFSRIYGYCLASCLFMHLVINVGMTIGLMPVIGIPLPFISYGGSSLLTFSMMFFIFLALYRNEKKYF